MLSLNGTILDTTAIIDFRWLNEWEWLKQNYSPLYVAQEVLDSDNLELPTRQAASEHLMPLTLDSEEMFVSFLEFGTQAPLLSEADRSTLALARHRLLLCASDDGLVIETCEKYGITYTRMLRLLTEMVQTEHKTVAEVKAMVQILIRDRAKRISPAVLASWERSLE
ncbi:MAG: hypothetical protein GDA56_07085 [Hormoscilla sp. GM7CHS1pb]|nr:hypothetical protein [Hormoscilla sp. GM7CHS1pb]